MSPAKEYLFAGRMYENLGNQHRVILVKVDRIRNMVTVSLVGDRKKTRDMTLERFEEFYRLMG